jgi:hypothetical protein
MVRGVAPSLPLGLKKEGKEKILLSTYRCQIFREGMEGTQVDEINLRWTRGKSFRLVRALRRIITLFLV